jgi:hypothetical protein
MPSGGSAVAAVPTTTALMLLLSTAAARSFEAFVGSVRVQALSPTLVRIEPKGPLGYEDRSTFMVTNRATFKGIPIHQESRGTNATTLATAYYKIELSDFSPPEFSIRSLDEQLLYSSSQPSLHRRQRLHWPSPLKQLAYGLEDRPRFHVPSWGVSPAPVTVATELRGTNGYDFRNNVQGDIYVFLLGDTLGQWHASRQEFIALTGPCPVLPDYAFGTWFTYWHQYSENEAKDDISRWEAGKLPLDIWALDMNWSETYSRHAHSVIHKRMTSSVCDQGMCPALLGPRSASTILRG